MSIIHLLMIPGGQGRQLLILKTLVINIEDCYVSPRVAGLIRNRSRTPDQGCVNPQSNLTVM